MNKDTLLDISLEDVVDAIRARAGEIQRRGVSALFIYGSRSRQTHRPDSDLDVYVDYDRNSEFSLLKLARIQLVIEEATGLDVHITTANSIPAARMAKIAGHAVKVI